MSIKSNTFGRVELTGADATKFRRQATYGRPKAAAKRGAAAGSVMLRELRSSGSIKLKPRAQA